MAITLVDAGLIGSSANGNDVTLSLAGAQEGDLVLLFGGFADNASAGTPAPVTAGYTQQAIENPNTSGEPAAGVWTKFMGATPDSNVVGNGPASTTNGCAYGRYILRGVDADILDAAIVKVVTTVGFANPGAVVTQTADALVIVAVADVSSSRQTTAAPSGYSNFLSVRQSETWPYSLGAATKAVASPATEDPGHFTWNTSSSSGFQVAFTVALRPVTAFAGPDSPELSVNYTDTDASMATSGFVAHDDATGDTHLETQWQITTDADTDFAAPFVDVTSTVYLLAYLTGAVLSPSTAYRARARHVGYIGGEGEWSNVVEFTTEAAAPQPETPTLSDPPTNIEEDEVTLTLSAFDSSEGTTTAEDFDPENPLPYLVAIQWQITLTADTTFADPEIDTELAANLDLVRTFDGLTANTAYRARARQQDGYYGTVSDWSNVVEFTTDAEPADRPGTPEIYVDCNPTEGGVALTSTAFAPFGAETHAQSQWRARPTTTSAQGADAPTTSSELTSFTGWPSLPAGTWWFDVRHLGSNGKWSLYSSPVSCLIYERPPVVTIDDPVSGVVIETPEVIRWSIPTQNSDVAFDYTVQVSGDEGTSWTTVQQSTTETYTFQVASRVDGVYWVRVQACYPSDHEASGRCGDWSYVQLKIDRNPNALSIHYDFREWTEIPEQAQVLWDSTNVTWSLVDRCLSTSGAAVGILAKNHRQLATRQSVLAFTDIGKPLAGRFTTSFAIVPTEDAWFGHKFAHVGYMRGGVGYRVIGTGATDRSGLQFVAKNGVQPWPFYGQSCICSCGAPFSPACICCENNYCAPCETCHAMPTSCKCTEHLGHLARRSRTQSDTVWSYGVAYRQARVERWSRRQGSASNTAFYASSLVGYEGDQQRGLGVATRPEAPDGDDLTCGTCVYQLTWYTMDVDVRREGSGWRVRSRIVGPGLDPATGFQQSSLLSLGESDGSMPCGYCGLALWQIGSNLTNDHGVLFRSFSASGLEYEDCAPAETPCVSGYAAIRILSIDRHPAHGVIDAMVVGHVPCPE